MDGDTEVYMTKDLTQTKFVIMYNDTPEDSEDIHDMDVSKWHVIVEADMTSFKGMVNGTLTTLGAGGGGGTVDTAMSDSSTNAVQNKIIKAYVDGLVGDIQEDMLS